MSEGNHNRNIPVDLQINELMFEDCSGLVSMYWTAKMGLGSRTALQRFRYKEFRPRTGDQELLDAIRFYI